jgi:hypothetical protein
MNKNVSLDDQAMVAEALRRMSSERGSIPADKVKQFLAKVGKEMERSGGLTKDHVEQHLRELKNGEIQCSWSPGRPRQRMIWPISA